ncbi:hypothetical protein PR202_ga29768 [Eleusine coracana subsp. coracana]|uniref:Uncharacterized protein n=1 Tax=Eleusine coracana subsp. coracana TaxID=191504 RepID=A0AAV5DMH7_ELECO|nr:hypothetical protein PR202_ga29768 [Eleusine coracana subsp. coracana]
MMRYLTDTENQIDKGVASALTLNSRHQMPAVGLGVWRMEKPAIRSVIHSALHIGYRHLDCAGKPPKSKSDRAPTDRPESRGRATMLRRPASMSIPSLQVVNLQWHSVTRDGGVRAQGPRRKALGWRQRDVRPRGRWRRREGELGSSSIDQETAAPTIQGVSKR